MAKIKKVFVIFVLIFMEKTWASGPIELLNHAKLHLVQETAFDKRIAFISIDNSVEISIRTFLSLPNRFFKNNRPSRKEFENASNSFPCLLDLLVKYAGDKFVGLDPMDIEFYHRIRNKLYHDGTGLSVDDEHISAYFTIAKLLLEKLFNFEYTEKIIKKEPTLDDVLIIWNEIEKLLEEIFYLSGIDDKHTYKWEEALNEKILTIALINLLTEVRMERNRIIHSTQIYYEDLDPLMKKAKRLKQALVNKAGKLEEERNI